ncbi:RNA 2'-phosphotransferase [Desulfatitalea tepidiphila]|uniref:RNA 2'-phosphotransferase n=1 Tax=Desulfatitalea tepidiphila TaxID=1185843 RepID=UPI0006B67E2B|nr:RNA 2'-phosphotransferase [Desulfatitalea tepidiphila]
MVPKEIVKLEKFLLYVLSRHPDEFGLLPDAEGYFKIKSLLQALHEEVGWKHIRQSHIDTLLLLTQPAKLEINGPLIRARQRDCMPALMVPDTLPKLLHTAIRRRAYRWTHENGILPAGQPFILLSTDLSMAMRIGKRIDNDPILLTVQTAKAASAGSFFRQFGERLYLADRIEPATFSGPPLPKEQPDIARARPQQAMQRNETPGSFFMDPQSDPVAQQARKRQQHRDQMDRKKQRRMARKEKERHWQQ